MADGINPYDVNALERAVNDSAGRVSTIWLSFVAFSAYLAAAASMITHRQIFLQEPIKLPTINIDLPLVASAVLLPLVFVIYHVYVLLQVVLLARTAAAYNEALDAVAMNPADNARVRQRLANTLFGQLFAGSPRERRGILGVLLRVMVIVTLAVAPPLVLFVFELKFLPYHSGFISWGHRGLIAFDLLAVLLLWAGAVNANRDIALHWLLRDWKSAIAALLILLACGLVTFPGEPHATWTRLVNTDEPRQCSDSVLAGLFPWNFDRLSLAGEDFVDDDKLDKIVAAIKAKSDAKPWEGERSRDLRGRDLSCGNFAGTDLRHADFTGAVLAGAQFDGARLTGSRFEAADLRQAKFAGAEIENAYFKGAQLQRANLRDAKLNNASFDDAHLEYASLENTQLAGASFSVAHMNGALLSGTNAPGASFGSAELKGASFIGGNLQRASFHSAQLQGAMLAQVNLQGASLRQAQLHGATLDRVNLQGADLSYAELQGAVLNASRLNGAFMTETQLQGAQLRGTQMEFAVLSRPFLWRTVYGGHCDMVVIGPRFDAIAAMTYPHGTQSNFTVAIAGTTEAVATFVDQTTDALPEPGRRPEQGKERVRKDLTARLLGEANAATLKNSASIWTMCAKQSETSNLDADVTAAKLIEYLCESGDNRAAIIAGVARNWASREHPGIPLAAAVAARLINLPTGCAAAPELDEDTKTRLADIAKPPQ